VADVQTGEWFSRRVPPPETRLRCADCGVRSSGIASGWRGHLRDDGAGNAPHVVFTCPDCGDGP
jgi:hypothetical protein